MINYTECLSATNPNQTCSSVIRAAGGNLTESCVCLLDIELGNTSWEGPVFMYYGLTNFYQNHRRYFQSRDDKQLYGQIGGPPSVDCEPFRVNPDTNRFYAPCGAIANSMFDDRISLRYREKDSTDWGDVPLLKTGIAWPSDRKYKFRNPDYARSSDPAQDWKALRKAFEDAGLERPKDWKTDIWALDKEDPNNNGFLNEDLIVWMRTAILPNFRKLYRRVDHRKSTPFANGLPHDKDYQLRIEYNYDVDQLKATKQIILATTTSLGSKNTFLGVAYILVGSISLIVGVVFLFNHLRFGTSSRHIPDIGPRTPYHG